MPFEESILNCYNPNIVSLIHKSEGVELQFGSSIFNDDLDVGIFTKNGGLQYNINKEDQICLLKFLAKKLNIHINSGVIEPVV